MTSISVGSSGRGRYYYGWNIVAVCILAQVAGNALPINAFSLFLQSWSVLLHTPISTLQLGLAACGLTCALGAPLVGMIADKYPARWLFATGLVAMALFCLGISLVEVTWQFIALYAILAPVSIMLCTAVPANAAVSRWFVRRLGLALGLSAFGLAIAGVIMPPIVAIAMPLLGWRAIWQIGAAVIAFVILPIVMLVLRERPTEREGLHYLVGADGKTAAHHGHGGGRGASTLTLRDILTRRNFWLLVLVYLPMLALYGGAGQNVGPIAASHGLSAQTAGLLLSSFSLAQLVSTLAGGMLSDRLGNRIPLGAMALVTAAGGVILAFGQNVATIGLGVMFAGCGGGFWPLLAAACAAEFGSAGVGRAFGMLNFFLPGAMLAPFLVAKLQETGGSYTPSLLTLAAAAFVGGAACLLFMREKRKVAATDDTIVVGGLAAQVD